MNVMEELYNYYSEKNLMEKINYKKRSWKRGKFEI